MSNDNKEKNNEHNHGKEKEYSIIINGRPKTVTSKELSYEEIVNLAFNNNPPSGQNVVITVTYAKSEHNKQGTLLPGDSIKIKNGMVFNVRATDRS